MFLFLWLEFNFFFVLAPKNQNSDLFIYQKFV